MFNYGLPPEVVSLEELIWFKKTHKGSAEKWVKVSGIAPVTLSNAIEKPLKSLVQYGKCEVSGNDIVCNNGVLRIVDDELPSGYKRIESIDFDGDFWYETNESLTGDDDITLTLANTVSSGQNVFGSYNGTSSGSVNFSLYIYGGTSTSYCYFRYGEQLVRPRLGSGERTITFGKSGTSGFATDVSVTPDTFETPANTYIGMLPNSSSPTYTGCIIGSILVGTRLKYIPCERTSDGAIGYYEAVKGVFLEPSGTGTPTKGNYDTSHEMVAVVGNSEVLTIGNNLITSNLTGYGTYVSPTVAAGNRAYKRLDDLPNGTYRFAVEGDYEIIVQWRDPADESVTVQSYENITNWMKSDVVTLDKSGGGYGLAVRRTSGTSSITPNNFDGTLYCFEAVKMQTASVENLFAAGDYEDTQDIVSGLITHKVGIKVFDGTENVSASGAGWAIGIPDKLTSKHTLVCAHYPYSSATMANAPDKSIISFASVNIGIKDSSFTSKEDVTAWLASQYAAGTPVFVIYPLKAETTETVGAQSLETTAGSNVVSVTAEVSDITLEIEYCSEA